MTPKVRSAEIRKFIVDHVGEHPHDIAKVTAEKFHVTRQAVNRHLATLIEDEAITAKGRTREREYSLKVEVIDFALPLAENRDEDKVWRAHVESHLAHLPDNVVRICHYGFTEIFNNAIDHSGGTEARVRVECSARTISIVIGDDGVGIFEKIRKRLNLDDHRRAIFELSKGKLTTDPEHHTGQGIFFTSRIFDRFSIRSDELYFGHHGDDDDWLIETCPKPSPGTRVELTLAADSGKRLKDLFDRFADLESGDYDFSKTHVPVSLAKYGEEYLVSRSQAKRVLARFDSFKEIMLDFDGVDAIGQAFADEIFRVFQNQHPELRIIAFRTNQGVAQMISRAIAARRQGGPETAPTE